MSSEIFHTIRACNRQFTGDEWRDYCHQTTNDDSKRIYNTFGKYRFNDCDICINPEIEVISIKEGAWGYYVRIKYAECGNGLWSYGIDYNTGTRGGGCGVSWVDNKGGHGRAEKGYPSERECKIAAADCALRMLDKMGMVGAGNDGQLLRKLIEKVKAYKHDLERPQVVQLELF